jgi:hypothetical protein
MIFLIIVKPLEHPGKYLPTKNLSVIYQNKKRMSGLLGGYSRVFWNSCCITPFDWPISIYELCVLQFFWLRRSWYLGTMVGIKLAFFYDTLDMALTGIAWA